MKAAFFQYLPTGGAVRVASQQIFNLRTDFNWRLHIPEGAAPLLPPSELTETRYPFPEGAKLAGARKLLAPVLLWKKASAFVHLCGTIAAAIDSEGTRVSLIHSSLIITSPPLLYMMETPSVYYCHEYPRYLYEKKMYKTGSRLTDLLIAHLLRRDRRLDLMAARAASVLVTNSSYMAGELERVYEKKAVVANPGIDIGYFTPDAEVPRRNMVLSVGALSEFKGHDLAIEAVASIPARDRPELMIVGDRGSPAYGTALARMAESTGVAVRVARGITNPELVNLYRSSRIVICAQRNEPYGLVPLEAMACGTPVVAVDQGGFPGNIRDGVTGLLVPRTADAVAEGLARLLGDPGLAGRMGSEGRLFVERERSSVMEANRIREILLSTTSPDSVERHET